MASLEELSEDIGRLIAPAIETVFKFLWNNPMVDNTGGIQNSEGISAFQNLVFPLVTLLATAGLLVAAIRLLWYRRLDPMMDTVKGLLVLVFTTFAGVFVIQGLVDFGNGLAEYMLSQGVAGDFGARLSQDLTGIPEGGIIAGPFRMLLSVIIGIAVVVGATIQIVALFYTQGVVYICAAVLPLAASAAMIPGPGTTIFSKIMGWLLGSILYKPVIALIYALGFIFYYESSGDEDGVFQYFLGVALILIATGALPMLWSLLGTVATKLTGGAVAFGAAGAVAGAGGGGGGGFGGTGFSGAGNAAQGSGVVSRAAAVDQGLPSATTVAATGGAGATGAAATGTAALGGAGAAVGGPADGGAAQTGGGVDESGSAEAQSGAVLPAGAENSDTAGASGNGGTGTATPGGAARTATPGAVPASTGGGGASPVAAGAGGGGVSVDGGGSSAVTPTGVTGGAPAVTPTGATGGSGAPGGGAAAYASDGGSSSGGAAVTPAGAAQSGGWGSSPVAAGAGGGGVSVDGGGSSAVTPTGVTGGAPA
ncbi:hypothetical protein, partial [Thermobifida halotolerans]|uniref:hypothetical protein n=1 Tax=Thermobifida halotolerans TaxID=483545 RepID=UPI000839AA01